MNEIEDRNERAEVFFPDRPVPVEAVAKERSQCSLVEPATLCFTLHHRSKLIRTGHAAKRRSKHAARPFIGHAIGLLIGRSGTRLCDAWHRFFRNISHFFRSAERCGKRNARVLLGHMLSVAAHPLEGSVLRFSPT